MDIHLMYEKSTNKTSQFLHEGIVVVELTKVVSKDKRTRKVLIDYGPNYDDYLVYINDTFLSDVKRRTATSKFATFATEYLTKIRKVAVDEVATSITGAAVKDGFLCLQIQRRNDKDEIYYDQLKHKLLPIT